MTHTSLSPPHAQMRSILPSKTCVQWQSVSEYQIFNGEEVSMLMSDDESFEAPFNPRFSHWPMADTASRNSSANTPIMAYSPNF